MEEYENRFIELSKYMQYIMRGINVRDLNKALEAISG